MKRNQFNQYPQAPIRTSPSSPIASMRNTPIKSEDNTVTLALPPPFQVWHQPALRVETTELLFLLCFQFCFKTGVFLEYL